MFKGYARSPYSHNLVTQGVVLDVIAPYRSQMADHLILMIKHKNSKSKGAGVACLSEYFINGRPRSFSRGSTRRCLQNTKDGGMRELILQREANLLVDLMTSLFGEHNHCHDHDKGAVLNAFASIATHSTVIFSFNTHYSSSC